MLKRNAQMAFLGLLMLLPAINASAQDNCGGAIVNAKALYDQGKLKEVIEALTPCLTHSFDRTNLWQGYKLMALSYLALNDPENARKAAEDMLEINPQFSPSLLKDQKDFIDLVNSIVVIPKFSLGLSGSAGLNSSFLTIGTPYEISDYTKTYSAKAGYQLGIFGGYNLNRHIDVGLGIYDSYKNYGISYTTNGFDVNVNEKLSYIEVPLTVKYTFGKGRLKPYLEIGAYEGFLISANSDFNETYTLTGEKFSDNNVSSDSRRNKTNFGVLGGVGLTYKVGSGHFVLDVRYCDGLTNIINGSNRYADENIYFKYYYLDDDLSISNLLVSVGYVYYVNYKVIRHKIRN